jgi:hypothetical protein
MTVRSRTYIAVLIAQTIVLFVVPQSARAQTPATPAVASQPDPDLQAVPSEPDFTLTALPSTLRMPSRKFAFRLTHRFTRPIAEGSVSSFFANFFNLDSPARIGLELRYGIRPGTQVTAHRTNDRAIQFLGQHQILGQSDSRWVTVDAVVAVEGLDNFSEEFSGSVGALISRRFGDHGAVYLEPMFVSNANVDVQPVTTDEHTTMIGVGGRLRLGQSRTYVLVEAAPRVAGYDVGVNHVSVAIEKRVGGHVFQFNVSNSFATTLRQLARGGTSNSDWFIGFNLTRRFY